MEQEPVNEGTKDEKNNEMDSMEESRSMVVAKDILPDTLPLSPLYNRPMFPRMVGPVSIENEDLIKLIIEEAEQSQGHAPPDTGPGDGPV